MTKDNALKIIDDNYNASNDSFLFWLHERDSFRADRFEALCDAVEALSGKQNPVLTQNINFCYQGILKEIIYHFNPNDSSEIMDFPENYTDYLAMFDGALARYYLGGK